MKDYVSSIGLKGASSEQHYQLSVPKLVEIALANQEGVLSDRGSLVVNTGKYTGRSPQDRFIVDTPLVHNTVDWGDINRPIAPEVFDKVFQKMQAYLEGRPLYLFEGYVGADHRYAMPARFINELASQNLFVHQLFIRPTENQLKGFQPEFTVICAPGLKLDPKTDGVHSEAAVLLNFDRKLILIAATQYSGEMKKSLFSTMNYLMPDRNVFPMHCSANIGKNGRSALFFGLSGTGKTTLSADPERTLVGDDEHGWSEAGIFNFEGGCYAKAIRLSKKNEPEIWDAIRFGSISENVILDLKTRKPDFNDDSLTENTRVAYPIDYIPNADLAGVAPHPSTIIFLTADAFGVMPPIAKLTEAQAQYHFISGYTSKLAGTERDILEPKAAFSTCFGAPFMPRPASVYADMLKDRILTHQANVYLINTGWQGGPYGIGERISIPYTRAMVKAALEGELETQEFWTHPIFNIQIPKHCPGVPDALLDPAASWSDKAQYEEQSLKLAKMFIENFKQFKGVEHLAKVGPQLPSLAGLDNCAAV